MRSVVGRFRLMRSVMARFRLMRSVMARFRLMFVADEAERIENSFDEVVGEGEGRQAGE